MGRHLPHDLTYAVDGLPTPLLQHHGLGDTGYSIEPQNVPGTKFNAEGKELNGSYLRRA